MLKRIQRQLKRTFVVLGVFSFLFISAGIVLYRFPDFFDISDDQLTGNQEYTRGVLYTRALRMTAADLTGYLTTNDLFIFPTAYLDNLQNFQLGELESIRFATRVLRNNLSRARSTDVIDPDINIAMVSFSNDPLEIVWPRAETKFGEGVAAFVRYEKRLRMGNAKFYANADGFNEFLLQFISLVGGANERLARASRDENQAVRMIVSNGRVTLEKINQPNHTAWFEIDDNYYYARGIMFVLQHLMIACRQDFHVLIKDTNTEDLIDSIVLTLNLSQMEPLLIMNGDSDSIWANHSLQLQARINDVWQKMEALRQITMM